MWAKNVVNKLQVQRNTVKSHDKYVEKKVEGLKKGVHAMLEDFKQTMQSLQANVVILKKNILQGSSSNAIVAPKVRVL